MTAFLPWMRDITRITNLIGVRTADLFRTADVSFFFDFQPPPYGGGNQFLLALRGELERTGYRTETNRISARTRACIFNSFNFDPLRLEWLKRRDCRLIHRVDGPISVYRNSEEPGLDRDIWELNRRFADATVFQSAYSLNRHREMGLEFNKAVIISNAVDSGIFHNHGRVPFGRDRRIRLVTSSWSMHPNKGADIFKWMDENLDWSHYEMSFFGRSPVNFQNIRMVSPLASAPLADELRKYDIFITASRHEACSNALLEALSCGLPALYINSGSNPEIAGAGGLGFNAPEEIPIQLSKLIADYSRFQSLIQVPTIQQIAGQYLTVCSITSH
jgi:glycosyltransferase involved in cell wall biosynthesis